MITIVCALYQEAAMLIKHYSLKKIEYSAFSIFENKEEAIRLVISGVGPISAATATGTVFGLFGCEKDDYLLNFGLAAGQKKELFLINKITEEETCRTFYPDMLIASQMAEAEVITASHVVTEDGIKPCLYDMEAAAIYQAAIHFLGPHKMSFLKLVSDSGDADTVTPAYAEKLIENNSEKIIEYIDTLRSAVTMHGETSGQEELFDELEELYEKTCQDMHCSVTMARELQQQFKYHSLSGNGLVEAIKKLYERQLLPCKSKKEGKVCFDELRKSVLQ